MTFSISDSQSQALRDKFLTTYPDFKDFEEPGEAFSSDELAYKRKLLTGFQSSVSREEAVAMALRGEGLELLRKMAGKAGNLAHFTSWGKTFGKDDQTASSLLTTLLEITATPWAGPETIAPLFREFARLRTKPDWGALSVGLWLWRPEDYSPIKISSFRRYAKSGFGMDLPSGAPTPESFAEVRDFLESFRPVVEQWQPRDWIDIQSFIYVLAINKAGGMLASPFDEIFDDRQQAISAFEWMKKGAEYLGLSDQAINDQRVSATLPVKTSALYPRRLRFNFGNLIAFSFFGAGKEKRRFQFSCLNDRIPEGSWTHASDNSENRPVSGEVGGPSFTLIRVSLAELESPEIEGSFRTSMEELGNKFKNWKGTPYRNYHNPQLLEALFDNQALDLLLSEGLPDEDGTLAITQSVVENYTLNEAMDGLFMPEIQFQGIVETLRNKLNVILQGAPGVGKSFCAKRVAYALMGEKDDARVSLIQFHQSYGYEDFIQGWRPNANGGFELRNGHFYRFCEMARADQNRPYVLIIDEINRGNLSRIFGELMVLLEPDKRGLEMALTYTPDDSFFVPKNLHVIGLMNTADRSLAVVDYALRRRFAFATLEPRFDSEKFSQALQEKGITKAFIEKIRSRMCALNAQIAGDSTQLGPGFQIGHSFFVPTRDIPDETAWFENVVRWEILPLLEEYWIDDRSSLQKAKAFLEPPNGV